MEMEGKNSWNDQKDALRGVGRAGVSSLTDEVWRGGGFAFAFSSAWLNLSVLLLTRFLLGKEMAVHFKYAEPCITKGV